MGYVLLNKLFEEHRKLAYKLANKYSPNELNDRDDIEQTALIGLWRATLTFKSDRGAFSTHAYVGIRAQLGKLFDQAYVKNRVIPNRQPIEYIKQTFDCTIEHDCLVSQIKQLIEEHATETQKKIFELEFKGHKINEIARELGVSHQNVSQNRQCAIKRVREVIAA